MFTTTDPLLSILPPVRAIFFTVPSEHRLAELPIHAFADVREALIRHLAGIRLLGFHFVLDVVNRIDRANLAYAAVGMRRAVSFSVVFGSGAGVIFVSYLALQITGASMVEHFGARRVISSCMVAWGSVLVHTLIQFYVARFVFSAAEAGFFPGVIVYPSYVAHSSRAREGHK